MSYPEFVRIAARESLRVYDHGIEVGNHSYNYNIDPGLRKEVFFSVRGTDDLMDMFSNIFVFGKNFGSGNRVHKGFYNAAEEILEAAIRKILELNKDGYYIYFCGHSMGGSIADLIRVILIERYGFDKNRLMSITFGQARVWRRSGPNIGDCLRVWHDDDPIVRIPYFLYSHRNTMNIKLENEGWFSFSDHKMKSYYFAIMGSDL